MKNKFNWQSFISIGLLFSFILMLLSGVILYIAPEGSLSRWIQWSVLSLSKKQWEQQHTVFSYLFIFFTILHIFKINWMILISYFKSRNLKFRHYREIAMAFVITLMVFVGTALNWGPFNTVVEWGANISDSHSKGVELVEVQDPEKLTLEQFANQVFDITYKDLANKVQNCNFENVTADTEVKVFCRKNNISPEEFYLKLKSELLLNSSAGSLEVSSSDS